MDLIASVAQIVRDLVVHAVVEVCATVEVTANVLTVIAKRESVLRKQAAAQLVGSECSLK